jgi:hypothetical protein
MSVRFTFGVVAFLVCWSNVSAASEVAAQAVNGMDPYLSTPSPGGIDPYMHNGSDVLIETRGNSIHIRYEKPRPGLAAVGAKPGTLLLTGTRSGDDVEGTAYIFKANCPPAPYSVHGRFSMSPGWLVPCGRALSCRSRPRVRHSCASTPLNATFNFARPSTKSTVSDILR